MADKEATARIKINKLLETAGWRFFAEGDKPANIRLEPSVSIKTSDLDALGENFEKTSKGFIDFLLLVTRGFPLIVVEVKAEDKNPLVGKAQARKYAKSQNCRFVMLSNGNLHYFWDLEHGNPHIITSFPTPESVTGYQRVAPNPQRLIDEQVKDDYIVLTRRPHYQSEAAWRNAAERPGYIQTNKLRFLRPYQLHAVQSLQRAVKDGKDRFLFEMATGKTLTAAAVIKLFLRSGNASRVLFLVDRLELEDQVWKAFVAVLSADFKSVIYKESRDEWRHAEIVVTTVQALLFNNKYQRLFSPTDFDLVISDEAHRSIGGNARAVFDSFVGYKLGLTATPRDYLKRFDKTKPSTRDPREAERRLLLDTYRILLSHINSLDHLGKTAIFLGNDGDVIHGINLIRLVPDSTRVDPRYAIRVFKTDRFINTVKSFAQKAVNQASVKTSDLRAIRIPLPPLEKQKEIVAEIEGYQKVINGARADLDNYRPHIPIHPDWPIIRLGDVCSFKNGLNFTKDSSGLAVKIIGVSDFKGNLYAPLGDLDEVHLDAPLSDEYLVRKGDILFVRSNGNPDLVGRTIFVPSPKEPTTFSGFTIRGRIEDKRALPIFYAHFFKSRDFAEMIKTVGQGANIRNLSQGILNELKVPLPPLATQQSIVAEIEAEQALGAANHELIARFEKKIQATLARVWGEDATKLEDVAVEQAA